MAEPLWSRTITSVIDLAGKLVAKDGTCVRGIEGEVIGLSSWLMILCCAYLFKGNSYTGC